MRFANKVVVVTGAAKGIGEGCARVFCKEGATVAILDVDDVSGRKLAEELSTLGPGRAVCLFCDVRQPDQIRAAIEQTAQQFGRLDCLVNNAGWHPPALTIEQTTLVLLEDQMRLNFTSTFIASQAAVPHLRKTQGSIVNISSMTAILGQEHATAYAASKAAQLGFTKSLAIELGPDNVRVNAILPSHVDTPLLQAWGQNSARPGDRPGTRRKGASPRPHGPDRRNRPRGIVPRVGGCELRDGPVDSGRRGREFGLLMVECLFNT